MRTPKTKAIAAARNAQRSHGCSPGLLFKFPAPLLGQSLEVPCSLQCHPVAAIAVPYLAGHGRSTSPRSARSRCSHRGVGHGPRTAQLASPFRAAHRERFDAKVAHAQRQKRAFPHKAAMDSYAGLSAAVVGPNGRQPPSEALAATHLPEMLGRGPLRTPWPS
jgi:hypothetical protein